MNMIKFSFFNYLLLSILVLPINHAVAEGLGGYAVIDSEGVVHGVIVATSSDPYGNGGVMPHEYMGCPAGCRIVQQSTADKNGNVAGIHGPNVKYNDSSQTFVMENPGSPEIDVINIKETDGNIDSTQIETNVARKFFEFGVQDLRDSDGQFTMTEVSAPKDIKSIPVNVSVFNKTFQCNSESIYSCRNISSELLESIDFTERKTIEDIRNEVIVKNIRLINANIEQILNRLKFWVN